MPVVHAIPHYPHPWLHTRTVSHYLQMLNMADMAIAYVMRQAPDVLLRVMLVEENMERSSPLQNSLRDAGYTLVSHLPDSAGLNASVAQLQPDVIIIDTESPSRDTLEQICVMSRDDPRTIFMFTIDGETEKIRAPAQGIRDIFIAAGARSDVTLLTEYHWINSDEDSAKAGGSTDNSCGKVEYGPARRMTSTFPL